MKTAQRLRVGDLVNDPATGKPGRVKDFFFNFVRCEMFERHANGRPKYFRLRRPENTRRPPRAPLIGSTIEVSPMRDKSDWLAAKVVKSRPLVVRIVAVHPVWTGAEIVYPVWRRLTEQAADVPIMK